MDKDMVHAPSRVLSLSEGMIERVAKALAPEPWKYVGSHDKDVFRQLARTAVEAMREPTPEMVEAMKGALHDWREALDSDERMLRHTIRDGKPFHSCTDDEKHAIRWRAGIDAALQAIPTNSGGR